jgi:hypothetical protein
VVEGRARCDRRVHRGDGLRRRARPGSPVILLSNEADAATWAEAGITFEHGASTPGVQATTAAYRHGGPWLDEVVGYLDGSRRLLADLLAAHLPSVRYQPPEGTYLAWLDCRDLVKELGTGVPRPAAFLLSKAQVVLTDGAACGDIGQGHVRLNFATPRPASPRSSAAWPKRPPSAERCLVNPGPPNHRPPNHRPPNHRPFSPSSSGRRWTRG